MFHLLKWLLRCIAFFPSLFFLSISSLEQEDLGNVSCQLIFRVRDLFLKIFTVEMVTTLSLLPFIIFIMFHSLYFLLFFSQKIRFFQNVLWKHITDHSIASSSLNCRQGIYLENLVFNMISMYSLLYIKIPNAMTRQQEQNMINLYKHVLSSWQINEKEDIVKLACFFKNWTRYELHIISKLLLTTNVLIPEESKEIKQRQWSENLAKEAIIGLNANKH